MFAYDETARIIIQKDCNLILNPLKLTLGLPQQLQAVITKKFVFSINLTEDSFTSKARRQYLVKHVLERLYRPGSLLNTAATAKVNQTIQSPPSSSALAQNLPPAARAIKVQQETLQIQQENEAVS